MIKGCFIDDQPGYFKDVMLDDEKIATIKALSKNDYAEIEHCSSSKKVVNGEIILDFNSKQHELTRIKLSLTGHKDVGWELDRPITKENIGMLTDEAYDAINAAVIELEKQNQITEGIAKN